MSRAGVAASPRRAVPKPEEFTEQTRKCLKCLVEKPLDERHFKPTSSARVFGFRVICRECLNEYQRIYHTSGIADPVDVPSKDDLKDGVWTERDLEPRGDVPILRDWDLTCGMCGQLWPLRMTDRQASGLAARIRVQNIRCGKCRGWVGLDISFTTTADTIQLKPEPPDALEGPRYVNPGHFKGSAA